MVNIDIKERRTRLILGSAGVISVLTIIFIIVGQPIPSYGAKWYVPVNATCHWTDCYVEGNFSQNVTDLCFSRTKLKGIFPKIAKQTKFRYWGNVTRERETYGWVEHSYICQYDFNYTQDMAWCFYTTPENGTTKTIIVFKHNWTHGNIPQKTIWWNEWQVNGTEEFIAKGWKSLPPTVCIKKDVNYTFRLDFNVEPFSFGEFNISIGNFTKHPWWDTSYDFRRRIYNVTLVSQPANASNYFSVSDIDNNDINETLYVDNSSLSNLTVYYNNDSDIKGVANGTNDEVFWFITTPSIQKGGSRPDELIRYFPFDNTEATVIDYANYSNGTITGTVTQNQTGQVYKAADFDGTDDYVVLTGDVEAYVTTGRNWSVSAWVKYDNLPQNSRSYYFTAANSNNDRIFFGWGDGEAGCADEMGVQSYDGAAVRSASQTGFSDITNWNHMVATQGADKSFKFYINGVSQGGTCYTGGVGTKGARFSGDTGGNYDFNGQLDEVLIFNKTISPAEVTALYELGAYMGSSEEAPAGDTTAPRVDLLVPSANKNSTNTTYAVQCNATEESGSLINISVYVGGVVNVTNTTNMANGTVWFVDISIRADGTYEVKCEACDNGNNCQFSSTIDIIRDTTSPELTWTWSRNTTSNVDPVNVSVKGNENLIACNVNISGTNYTMSQDNTTGYDYTWNIGADGNYTLRAYCNDTVNNTGRTTSAWYKLDATAPYLYWNWTDINSTTPYNSTTLKVNLSESGNCTLTFNGTRYVNSTTGTSITWNQTNKINGNYSTISVTCEDSVGNKNTTTTAWWKANYVPLSITSITLTSGIDWIKAVCTASSGYDITAYYMNITGQDNSNASTCYYVFQNITNGTLYRVSFKAYDSSGDTATNISNITTIAAALKPWIPQGDLDLKLVYRLLNVWKLTMVSPNGTMFDCRPSNVGVWTCTESG